MNTVVTCRRGLVFQGDTTITHLATRPSVESHQVISKTNSFDVTTRGNHRLKSLPCARMFVISSKDKHKKNIVIILHCTSRGPQITFYANLNPISIQKEVPTRESFENNFVVVSSIEGLLST